MDHVVPESYGRMIGQLFKEALSVAGPSCSGSRYFTEYATQVSFAWVEADTFLVELETIFCSERSDRDRPQLVSGAHGLYQRLFKGNNVALCLGSLDGIRQPSKATAEVINPADD
jgi:hypothetical protein